MFGTASSVAYARCGGSGNNALLVLSSIASGFGTSTGDGVYVYNLFNAQTGFTQSGFQNTDVYTTSLENVAGGIFGISGNALIGSAAIIYGYANFSNTPESNVLGYLNNFNTAVTAIGGGTAVYISKSGLDRVMRSFSLSGVNSSLAGLPSSQGFQKAINYNWYDATNLFANPNFAGLAQNIKDSENQYYYVSGEIIYPTVPSGLVPCVEFLQTINTTSGQISFPVIANTPCFRSSSYIGPVSGTKFYREFNDGPGSSGFFDTGTQAAYVDFDESVLSYNDYHSNNDILYSNQRDSSGNFFYLISGGQVDLQGFYNPTNEYGAGHTNLLISDSYCSWSINDFTEQQNTYFTWANYTGSGLPLQRMHQGDNQPKWVLTKYCLGLDGFGHCVGCGFTGQLENWTGWKFAPFQLKESLAKNYEFLLMNPAMDTGRVIKRALNLDNYTGSSPITPYASVADTGDGNLTCTGIVGPPQFNSNNPTLPGFAFYQTFDNITFPDYAGIVMRGSVESGGSYIVSNFNLVVTGNSGVHYPVFGFPPIVPINQVITSSGIASFDDVTKKCLAMGDNFGGNGVSGIQTPQSNAGYFYTGYTYYQSGTLVGVNQLLATNSQTIGNGYSTINYVSGYTGVSGTTFATTLQYAFIITGDTSTGINYFGQPILYSYFPNGLLGAENTGWNIFAPQPSGIIDDILNNNPRNFGEVYNSQAVENYLPRYASGPYLSYENSFLYPNAAYIFTGFNAPVNGFPTQISYEIQFQEETVTEVYCLQDKFGNKIYPNVIRPIPNVTGYLNTSMMLPFAPDNGTLIPYYSLTNTGLYPSNGNFQNQGQFEDTEVVDANWVPNINYTSDAKLNNIDNKNLDGLPFRWKCGIKINSGTVAKTMMTGVGKSGIVYVNPPAIKVPYWGYYGKTITGVMEYTLPIFDLSTESLQVPVDLSTRINALVNAAQQGNALCYHGHQAKSFNGESYGDLSGQTSFSGQDPIFYEYIGGRIGSGAEIEGGNHTEGLVGDSWYDLSVSTWGTRGGQCEDCPAFGTQVPHTLHGPEGDSHVFFIALSSSGLTIKAKNLSYYPYYYSKNYKPFINTPYLGIATIPRWLGSEYYFDFNLRNYFSITTATGNFYSTGITVGPFDRDVELCVSSGNMILPSGSLIVDGEIMNVDAGSVPSCGDDYSALVLNSGIIPGQGNRSPYITTFKLIPQGTISTINISGTSGQPIGFTGAAIATIRPRTFEGGTSYSVPYNGTNYGPVYGDNGYTDFSRFINNQTETSFTFPYQNFNLNSLVGQEINLQTTAYQTVLYPIPDPTDFAATVPTGVDKFGNITYPPNPTAYYWSIKTPNAYFMGVRDVTRLKIKINQISVSGLGNIPYESQRIIIPSGECVISGVFAYTGQAESAVVSDGIVLSGVSGARSLSGLFQPIYVSDAMTRLPAQIFDIPSGTGYMPVLPAPSFMKVRQNPFFITGNDVYIGTSPFSGADYNAFLWPAWSDLGLLNPELVYEQMPPDDGNVFMDSYLTFSAAQGQPLGATGFNLKENVTYKVVAQYGFIDSTSTNAVFNTGKCIFSGSASQTILDSGNLSGILTSEGNSLTMAVNLQNYRT